MDYVYDVAMDTAGDEVLDVVDLAEECCQRVDQALQAWLDLYHVTDEHGRRCSSHERGNAGVRNVDDQIIFCGLEAVALRQWMSSQPTPAPLQAEAETGTSVKRRSAMGVGRGHGPTAVTQVWD